MSKELIRKSLAFLLVAVMAFAVFGCAPKTPPEETGEPTQTEAPVTPTEPPVTEGPKPLVVSTGTLDGKFSPFFATSAYDVDVSGLTQIGLLYYDKNGEPQAGDGLPCLADSFTQTVDEEEGVSIYEFVLKDDVVFSDGEPVTAKDVLFSMYVLSDKMYDGSSTFYTMAIQGLDEYRLQTSKEALDKVHAMMAAGLDGDEVGKKVMMPASGVSKEDLENFWSPIDEMGVEYTQEIIDVCNTVYVDYIEEMFAPFTPEDVAADPSKQAAWGMVAWGFGEVDEEGEGIFTDALGNEYDLNEEVDINAETYWEVMVGAYSYADLDGIDEEAAGVPLTQRLVDTYLGEYGKVEGGVASITGITADTVDSKEVITIVIDGVDPTAIFMLGVTVPPFHYYTDGYEGELNDYGVDTGNPDFMDFLKTKNTLPVGAGPYIFDEYKDNVVSYHANELFLMGKPKTEVFRYVEITLGAELDALKTGEVFYADPSASTTIINDITSGEGDYAKLDYTLVDNDGYGYIGIQAQAIPEFEVRKALAHAMDVQLAVDDYYGELASVNNRTMTKVLWAYPDNPEDLFPYDGTGETSKELFLEAGYVYDEEANEMHYPAGHEKAGQQASFKFTLPSEAKDHPAGSILIDAQEVLAKIGVKVEIDTDQNLLSKLNKAYEMGIQVWAAAWGGGGIDPDMFQIWYSDEEVNQQPPRAGLSYLYKNGSAEEKEMLTRLNELIMAGRKTLDAEERKTIYKEALELSTGIAVEIPTYQRKNMFVYNKDVIKADTLFSGEDVTPFQSPLSFVWDVELYD